MSSSPNVSTTVMTTLSVDRIHINDQHVSLVPLAPQQRLPSAYITIPVDRSLIFDPSGLQYYVSSSVFGKVEIQSLLSNRVINDLHLASALARSPVFWSTSPVNFMISKTNFWKFALRKCQVALNNNNNNNNNMKPVVTITIIGKSYIEEGTGKIIFPIDFNSKNIFTVYSCTNVMIEYWSLVSNDLDPFILPDLATVNAQAGTVDFIISPGMTHLYPGFSINKTTEPIPNVHELGGTSCKQFFSVLWEASTTSDDQVKVLSTNNVQGGVFDVAPKIDSSLPIQQQFEILSIDNETFLKVPSNRKAHIDIKGTYGGVSFSKVIYPVTDDDDNDDDGPHKKPLAHHALSIVAAVMTGINPAKADQHLAFGSHSIATFNLQEIHESICNAFELNLDTLLQSILRMSDSIGTHTETTTGVHNLKFANTMSDFDVIFYIDRLRVNVGEQIDENTGLRKSKGFLIIKELPVALRFTTMEPLPVAWLHPSNSILQGAIITSVTNIGSMGSSLSAIAANGPILSLDRSIQVIETERSLFQHLQTSGNNLAIQLYDNSNYPINGLTAIIVASMKSNESFDTLLSIDDVFNWQRYYNSSALGMAVYIPKEAASGNTVISTYPSSSFNNTTETNNIAFIGNPVIVDNNHYQLASSSVPNSFSGIFGVCFPAQKYRGAEISFQIKASGGINGIAIYWGLKQAPPASFSEDLSTVPNTAAAFTGFKLSINYVNGRVTLVYASEAGQQPQIILDDNIEGLRLNDNTTWHDVFVIHRESLGGALTVYVSGVKIIDIRGPEVIKNLNRCPVGGICVSSSAGNAYVRRIVMRSVADIRITGEFVSVYPGFENSRNETNPIYISLFDNNASTIHPTDRPAVQIVPGKHIQLMHPLQSVPGDFTTCFVPVGCYTKSFKASFDVRIVATPTQPANSQSPPTDGGNYIGLYWDVTKQSPASNDVPWNNSFHHGYKASLSYESNMAGIGFPKGADGSCFVWKTFYTPTLSSSMMNGGDWCPITLTHTRGHTSIDVSGVEILSFDGIPAAADLTTSDNCKEFFFGICSRFSSNSVFASLDVKIRNIQFHNLQNGLSNEVRVHAFSLAQNSLNSTIANIFTNGEKDILTTSIVSHDDTYPYDLFMNRNYCISSDKFRVHSASLQLLESRLYDTMLSGDAIYAISSSMMGRYNIWNTPAIIDLDANFAVTSNDNPSVISVPNRGGSGGMESDDAITNTETDTLPYLNEKRFIVFTKTFDQKMSLNSDFRIPLEAGHSFTVLFVASFVDQPLLPYTTIELLRFKRNQSVGKDIVFYANGSALCLEWPFVDDVISSASNICDSSVHVYGFSVQNTNILSSSSDEMVTCSSSYSSRILLRTFPPTSMNISSYFVAGNEVLDLSNGGGGVVHEYQLCSIGNTSSSDGAVLWNNGEESIAGSFSASFSCRMSLNTDSIGFICFQDNPLYVSNPGDKAYKIMLSPASSSSSSLTTSILYGSNIIYERIIPITINDNYWHDVAITFHFGRICMSIDGTLVVDFIHNSYTDAHAYMAEDSPHLLFGCWAKGNVSTDQACLADVFIRDVTVIKKSNQCKSQTISVFKDDLIVAQVYHPMSALNFHFNALELCKGSSVHCGECIVFDRFMTNNDRSSIISILQRKWAAAH